MKTLHPHILAIYGVMALLISLVFVQAAAYGHSLSLGDSFYVVGAIALTVSAIGYGAKWEGLAFPSMIAMCLSFGLIAVFTSMTWLTRRMIHDIQVNFADTSLRNDVILYVVLPLVVAAILFPPVVRRFIKSEDKSSDEDKVWSETGA